MFAIHFAAKLLRSCSDFARECFLLQILPWCSHLAILFVVIFAAKLLRFCSKVAICERSLIGDNFPEFENLINGVVCNVCRKGDKICLWTHPAEKEAIMKIGLFINKSLFKHKA